MEVPLPPTARNRETRRVSPTPLERERVHGTSLTPLARLAAIGNKASTGPDHAKIAKLDRENEVAPPPTVSLELGKVIQKARQDYVNSAGEKKPLSQGDLAKMLNVKSTVVQECACSRSLTPRVPATALRNELTFSSPSLLFGDRPPDARPPHIAGLPPTHTHTHTHTLNTQTKT